MGVQHKFLYLLLIERVLFLFAVEVGKRYHDVEVCRVFLLCGFVHFVGFVHVAVLYIHVAEQHFVAQVVRVLFRQVHDFLIGALFIFHLHVDAEFLCADLFGLSLLDFEAVEGLDDVRIVFVAGVEIHEHQQKVALAGIFLAEVFHYSDGFVYTAFLEVDVDKCCAVPVVVGSEFYSAFQVLFGNGVFLQETLVFCHFVERHIRVGVEVETVT